jgi:hypothetical protein
MCRLLGTRNMFTGFWWENLKERGGPRSRRDCYTADLKEVGWDVEWIRLSSSLFRDCYVA